MKKTTFFLNVLILVLVAVLCHTPVHSAERYTLGTAGFSTALPEGFVLQVAPDGLELSRGAVLLSIENLGMAAGETVDVLQLFAPSGESTKVGSPYPGLRATLQETGYAAEIVILKTPSGFFLLSLEQESPDSLNQKAFEELLDNFALLDTPPFNTSRNLVQTADLGPINLSLPDGKLDQQQGVLIWKGNAAGMLVGEVVKHGAGQPLSSLLDNWERQLLRTETGLATRISTLQLQVEDREALLADYTGDKMQARVQLSAIDKSNVLVLALITRKETFASHQPVLDAVSFSVVPAVGTATQPAKGSSVLEPHAKRSYNEIVEAVSERMQLDPEIVNTLYRQKPVLFSKVKETLAAIKSFDRLATSDPESLVKDVPWEGRGESMLELQAFHTALRSYKVSLDLLPQKVTQPALPGKLSRTYNVTRSSSQSPVLAFNDAMAELGDFAGRKELYLQLLKAKGQTEENIALDLSRYLQGKADLYWRNRLEVAYQQNRLKQTRDRYIDQLWLARSQDLDLIRAALEQ